MNRLAAHIKTYVLLTTILLAFSACRSTKFVPQDKYLLNKTQIQVEDTKQVSGESLNKYLRQKPNTKVLGFWKVQLGVWNAQGTDSTKWINRQIRKIGEPPEIYSQELTAQSMVQLKRAMDNKGYFNSTVDTITQLSKHNKQKLNLKYIITANQPYHLRNYKINLPNTTLQQIAERRRYITDDMLFDANLLDKERERIANRMRNEGYYFFEKDMLRFIADSSYNAHVVDAELTMQDYFNASPDSIQQKVLSKYVISKITFLTAGDADAPLDTISSERISRRYPNYTFLSRGRKMLRSNVLVRNCMFRPGDLYSQRLVERTYARLNQLGAVKYVNISFQNLQADSLECIIVVSGAKKHTLTAELEGTFSAGDWGIGAGVGYVNRNLFGGSEQLSVNGKISYEWRENGGRALETKVDAALRFPNALQLAVGYSYQKRPDEFTRTIANAGLSYALLTTHNRWRHTFSLIDISYVYLPWISDAFSAEFLKPTNILKYSYEDHLIASWGYAGNYTTYRKSAPDANYTTIQYAVETAGNALYAASKILNQTPNSDGRYELFRIPYSQYVKADFSWTYHSIFNKSNRLVYHIAAGVAVPFGNASSIPFEKRYFAGGANSVRGWTIRSLGPGGYRGTGDRIDFNNQSGDVKLDLNLEYRLKVISVLNLAFFTDAGNIWTIRDYESQPNGQFRLNSFYKQIAWSYGAGIRLDFDFFVFRVDFGVKLYDPSRIYYDQKQWRTAANGLGWKDDMSFHFAIGYPF